MIKKKSSKTVGHKTNRLLVGKIISRSEIKINVNIHRIDYLGRHHRQEPSGGGRSVCSVLGVQRNLGYGILGDVEKERRGMGVQVGHFGSEGRFIGRA